jgi:hypothetical protein
MIAGVEAGESKGAGIGAPSDEVRTGEERDEKLLTPGDGPEVLPRAEPDPSPASHDRRAGET